MSFVHDDDGATTELTVEAEFDNFYLDQLTTEEKEY